MAAPARPYWTGFLKLSLVTIGVRLYTATTERDRVRFHQIHGPSGERVRQQLVVPGHGPGRARRHRQGLRIRKGPLRHGRPGRLKRMRLETTDTIDIVEFVDDIEPIYFDSPYYLVPDGSVAEEGYRVIREALAKAGKIAVGQVVINGQERIIAIRPLGTGLARQFGALRRRDQQARGFLRRDRRRRGRRGPARDHGADHRAQDQEVRRRQVRRPLPGGAARADRRKARGQVAGRDSRSAGRPRSSI